jgi:hypothetical protein
MATKEKEVLIAIEVNAETGEIKERELTAEEIADREAMATEAATQQAALKAKAAARASALAKLVELGLTEEEIAAL